MYDNMPLVCVCVCVCVTAPACIYEERKLGDKGKQKPLSHEPVCDSYCTCTHLKGHSDYLKETTA